MGKGFEHTWANGTQATRVWSKMQISTISTLDLIANILSTKTLLSYIADSVCVYKHTVQTLGTFVPDIQISLWEHT